VLWLSLCELSAKKVGVLKLKFAIFQIDQVIFSYLKNLSALKIEHTLLVLRKKKDWMQYTADGIKKNLCGYF